MMTSTTDIRKEFLNFFEKKGHTIEKSGPLVPSNDPTIMFTVAGMVPFKDVFTGIERRPYTRAATAQKCLRAGGKHNDLENVGYTARHHTFFEMLGNFSFGDYFKEEAISYGWELVTKNYGLDPARLLITVHTSDEESAAIWKKVTSFPDSRILRIPTDDNFWSMGDTGPCGPCTEIFYDHGDHLPGGPPGSPDEDGDRFVEIWNIVFMQFERFVQESGDIAQRDLPRPSVDTGSGLERVAAILQGTHDNYGIEIMRELIEHTALLTGVDPDGDQRISHRVIADHIRAATFLMADGVMPDNEGRGYVLRRIMRRAMRHAHLLGARDPLMHRLVPVLTASMGETYPEIRRGEKMIMEMMEIEEVKFRATLERGLKLLETEKEKIPAGGCLPGEVAFRLYDTYGFPLDLTQDALRQEGMGVDSAGFEEAMDRQKAEARAAWSGTGDAAEQKIWFDLLEEHGETEFQGYERETLTSTVSALVKESGICDKLEQGEKGYLITRKSPFYAESGGQTGDTGIIRHKDAEIAVTDTKKFAGKLWAHQIHVKKGDIQTGDKIEMLVDSERRAAIKANHSVTHLMHEALRQVLGEHVQQKGSLQDAHRTRFDISHPKALTAAEIRKVENIVNLQIWSNTKVDTRLMAYDEALEQGAMALFGEKYGDRVRVVSMGSQPPGANKAFSVELCGGTHVNHTGEIGLFKIVSESALSSGVRRLEALSRNNAMRHLDQQTEKLGKVAALMKASPDETEQRVQALLADRKKLEQEVSHLRRQMATGGQGAANEPEVRRIGDVDFIGRILDDVPARELKGMADTLTDKLGSGVAALVARMDGKASVVVSVTSDLTARYNAIDLVKIAANKLGGSGGGRPDMAQAGGPDVKAADKALAAIEQALSN